MINLKNDYCGIAHPKVLEKMMDFSKEYFNGYGLDVISDKAKELIKKEIGMNDVDIHFLVGGTIANKCVIHNALKTYEAVICADTGHINVHETGAIESTGHKVLTCQNEDGKVVPSRVKEVYNLHVDEHMVKPKMLYISNSTETGSVYTLSELQELSALCKELDLLFYMDGARLGAALTSNMCDYTLNDIAKLVDVFYIGGTKNGAMLGEAVVIINDKLKENFRFMIKHLGAMYSKGFVAGINFYALFEDGLFFEIAKQENKMANELYKKLISLGITFASTPQSNQIFPVFKNNIIEKIKDLISFEVWNVGSDETTIRFVTSYMTTSEEIDKTIEIIKEVIA